MDKKESTPHRLGAHQLREIAVMASVDPRTVKRCLEGQPVTASARRRVEAALEKYKKAQGDFERLRKMVRPGPVSAPLSQEAAPKIYTAAEVLEKLRSVESVYVVIPYTRAPGGVLAGKSVPLSIYAAVDFLLEMEPEDRLICLEDRRKLYLRAFTVSTQWGSEYFEPSTRVALATERLNYRNQLMTYLRDEAKWSYKKIGKMFRIYSEEVKAILEQDPPKK